MELIVLIKDLKLPKGTSDTDIVDAYRKVSDNIMNAIEGYDTFSHTNGTNVININAKWLLYSFGLSEIMTDSKKGYTVKKKAKSAIEEKFKNVCETTGIKNYLKAKRAKRKEISKQD